MTNLNIFVVLMLMFFFHIVDDFYLQGILANMKQKSWWKEKAPDKLYQYDYIVALIIHSMSWSVMIMLPVLYVCNWQPHWIMYLIFGMNIIIHTVVDDLKANQHKINLITDQSIHLVQIVFTWIIGMLML